MNLHELELQIAAKAAFERYWGSTPSWDSMPPRTRKLWVECIRTAFETIEERKP